MVIKVKDLRKYYHNLQKEPGLTGSVKSLFKRQYKEIKAVDNISFTLQEGELVGFIGPNGAGKTTTLKCLSGLLYPTSGKVKVLGFNPWHRKHQFLKQISLIMGQKNQLWWDLPAIETFILNREIYEIPPQKWQQTLNELVSLLEVEDILNIQVRKLSLGQRMKCELIAALLHLPQVLFLDEPTIGLDVVMQKKLREFIKVYNQKYKATILLTSHYMDDVKQLCGRVIIIDVGKIIFDGKLEELVERYVDHKLLKIVFSKDIDPKKLEEIAEVKEFSFPSAVLAIKREASNAAAAELLRNFPIADLNIEEPAIEDVIREVFTGKDTS
jgi:ABC-2 type transport system ATP-binding protein